jgi:hypothetical protein
MAVGVNLEWGYCIVALAIEATNKPARQIREHDNATFHCPAPDGPAMCEICQIEHHESGAVNVHYFSTRSLRKKLLLM